MAIPRAFGLFSFVAVGVLVPSIMSPGFRNMLVLDREVVDYGEIPPGRVREAWFSIRNTHSSPVKFTRTLTSCSCTKAQVSKSNPSPGQSTDVSTIVSFGDSKGARDQQVELQHTIGDDPNVHSVHLRIKANVAKPPPQKGHS